MVPDPLAPLHSDSLRAGRRPAGNAYFPVRIHSIDDIGDTVVIQGAIHCDYLEDMDTKKAKSSVINDSRTHTVAPRFIIGLVGARTWYGLPHGRNLDKTRLHSSLHLRTPVPCVISGQSMILRGTRSRSLRCHRTCIVEDTCSKHFAPLTCIGINPFAHTHSPIFPDGQSVGPVRGHRSAAGDRLKLSLGRPLARTPHHDCTLTGWDSTISTSASHLQLD